MILETQEEVELQLISQAISDGRAKDLNNKALDRFADFLIKTFNLVGRSIDVRFLTAALVHAGTDANGVLTVDPEILSDPAIKLYLNEL